MQDRIQLKREEIVGDGVALSDINPITNTKSVDDESVGVPLSVTIEKMWQAINNTLSRVVNSVNGRDGVVVITADDIGLGNVTNVSFSTIKDWVIDELIAEFGIKRLMLFDTMADLSLAMESWSHDKGHANIPFYIKKYSNSDRKSYIGYTYWDNAENIIALSMLPINVVGYTDNSLIYDEIINGTDLSGGGLGVNIKNGEDALKLYESSSKALSGLYIDKSKIAPELFFFEGVYGATGDPLSSDGLLYVDDGNTPASTTKDITIKINGTTIGTKKTMQTFKINDLIVTNFSDTNYRGSQGAIKQYLDEDFICREACIGRVTTVYDELVPGSKYTVEFFTIKPYVGMGLKYYDTHTDLGSVQSAMVGIDLINGKISLDNVTDNMSGLNAFNNSRIANPGIAAPKEHYTVTPVGKVQNTLTTSNGAFVAPDFSLNVIPYNSFTSGNSPITNWPTSVPPLSSVTTESFLGVNLLKKISASGTNAFNMSGLRIVKDTDTITNATLGKSDNDTSDNLAEPIDGTGDLSTSGGLAVNVGNFLEIGTSVGDDALPKFAENYYDGGKINVRVDDFTIGGVGDNKLGIKISKIGDLRQLPWYNQLGGGLTTTTGVDGALNITPGLTINKGLGVRMSKFNRFGVNVYDGVQHATVGYLHEGTFYENYDGETYSDPITPTEWGFYYDRTTQKDYCYEINSYVLVDRNYGFLTPSIFDVDYSDPDVNSHNIAESLYGGLRYIYPGSSSDYVSSIGLRVNNRPDNVGITRIGSGAIGISKTNAVGIQLYRESTTYPNPLEIKNADEKSIAPYIYFKDWSVDKYPTVSDFPALGAANKIYLDTSEDKRYVWNSSTSEYEPMYQYYPAYSMLPNPGETNKVYVVESINTSTDQMVVSAYTWRIPETVELPLGRDPVDSTVASNILAYYTASSTSIPGYLKDGYFYSDPNYINRIDYTNNRYYQDKTIGPDTTYNGRNYFVVYKATYNESTHTYDLHTVLEDYLGRALTSHDVGTMDVAHNGTADARDASNVLRFYTMISSTPSYIRPGETMLQAWQRFIKEEFGVISSDEAGDSCYVCQFSTAQDGSYRPGLDVDLNEYEGITAATSGDLHPSIAVKIFDYTNGLKNSSNINNDDINHMYNGGLRFNTDGYLGVRVNDSAIEDGYKATSEGGREMVEHTNIGTRGLRIYDNNVLGVQLSDTGTSTDNGDLCIDEHGNLKISPNYSGGGGGGGELLTITDGITNIEYNGATPVTITLGPGLILVPDPEPNPET